MYVKLNKKIKLALLIGSSLVTLIFYQNCSKASSDKTQSSSSATTTAEQEITNSEAMMVLTTRCASCHDSATKAGGVDVLNINEMLATGVVIPNEPSLSVLFAEIQNGRMPPASALSQSEMTAVFNWIQEGFKTPPNVIAPPPPATIPLAANFNSINTNILKTKCLGCHNAANTQGGVSFSTYVSTMNTVQKTLPMGSSLYTSVAVRMTMPKGGALLSAAETKVIFDWITAGAANN